ncbi:g12997 [Coccomyxa viridis]|uniref:G12997 protein n=1 Tax=Coccomyxa viridis TaxID=1274662 RepID=A0ABP1GIU7_9CHLO
MQNKQTPFSAGLRDALLQSAEEAHVNEAELKQMFYSELFPTFADTLLSVVSPEWLPSFSSQDRCDLFHSFFAQAPATSLLPVLVAHLSLVQPLSSASASTQGSLTVQAPGADIAAAILAERFALPDSSGIEELTSAGEGKGLDGVNRDIDELASLLVALPDRAAFSSLKALQSAAFAKQAVEHCIAAARHQTAALPKSGAHDSSKPAQAPMSRSSSFAAAVLTRLARREHASLIAQSAWKAVCKTPAADPVNSDSQALEKILAALLLEAPVNNAGTVAQVLEQLLCGPLWQRHGVRYLFEGMLLLRRCVPPRQLEVLVKVLGRLPGAEAGRSSLQQAAVHLAQAWGSEGSIQQLPVQQQAYMTAALIKCLQLLGREQLESTPGLFPALLTGVSARLDSPEGPLRQVTQASVLDLKQGMRVGKVFSAVLDPSKPALFSDLGDTELTAAEAWHPSCVTPVKLTQSQKMRAPLPSEQGQGADAGYDSDMSLEAYDLSEGPKTDDFEQEGRPLQLRDTAALLRKGDDPQAVLKGLRAIGPLIKAAPEELSHNAGEVARALLYARPPEWADKEAVALEQKASTQRFSALAAVCEAAPQEGGLALAKEVYSPHLDMHQRLTILDALSTAARQLSSALPASASSPKKELSQPEAHSGSTKVGKSRRWAAKSLAKQQEGAPRTRRNRFVGVAAQWTAALLDQVDQERQGVDLFGRDALVLGHVLSCLGTFVECASPAQITLWLASVVLELVAAKEVHGHSQPSVRRSALIAASQVMRALPAAGLAGLLAGGQVSEGVLAERLEWCRGWTQGVAMQDTDPQCQMLAAGCRSLQAKLAQEAMQALELGADSEPVLTGHSSRNLILPKKV